MILVFRSNGKKNVDNVFVPCVLSEIHTQKNRARSRTQTLEDKQQQGMINPSPNVILVIIIITMIVLVMKFVLWSHTHTHTSLKSFSVWVTVENTESVLDSSSDTAKVLIEA